MNEKTNGNLSYVIFLFREEISSEDHNYARVFNCFRDVMVLGYFKYLHQSEFCSSSHLIHKFSSVIMLVLKLFVVLHHWG